MDFLDGDFSAEESKESAKEDEDPFDKTKTVEFRVL